MKAKIIIISSIFLLSCNKNSINIINNNCVLEKIEKSIKFENQNYTVSRSELNTISGWAVNPYNNNVASNYKLVIANNSGFIKSIASGYPNVRREDVSRALGKGSENLFGFSYNFDLVGVPLGKYDLTINQIYENYNLVCNLKITIYIAN